VPGSRLKSAGASPAATVVDVVVPSVRSAAQ
jgi:hypothetical protein